MGMEQRGNNAYYYRKQWRNGTCVSEYVGNGPVAELMAEYEQLRRAEELYKRALFKREQRTIRAQAARVLGTEVDIRDLVKAVLLANGFHQHKRQWRKSMQQDTAVVVQPTAAVATGSSDVERQREGRRALQAALDIQPQPAKTGGKITEKDKVAAELQKRGAVRKVLADYPCIWGHLRHRLSTGQRALIEASCGGTLDSVPALLLEKSMTAMRTSLGYEQAPPLEQLLIGQLVFAWADLEYVQMYYAKSTFGSHTHTAGVYWDRRVNGAQARYMRAAEALVRVRRLAMPQPLQVNIGGQQVNVAGGRSIGANSEAP